jgi:hypothetical protein
MFHVDIVHTRSSLPCLKYNTALKVYRYTSLPQFVNMNLHVKAGFVAVEGGPRASPSWDLMNHDLGCQGVFEIPARVLPVGASKASRSVETGRNVTFLALQLGS